MASKLFVTMSMSITTLLNSISIVQANGNHNFVNSTAAVPIIAWHHVQPVPSATRHLLHQPLIARNHNVLQVQPIQPIQSQRTRLPFLQTQSSFAVPAHVPTNLQPMKNLAMESSHHPILTNLSSRLTTQTVAQQTMETVTEPFNKKECLIYVDSLKDGFKNPMNSIIGAVYNTDYYKELQKLGDKRAGNGIRTFRVSKDDIGKGILAANYRIEMLKFHLENDYPKLKTESNIFNWWKNESKKWHRHQDRTKIAREIERVEKVKDDIIEYCKRSDIEKGIQEYYRKHENDFATLTVPYDEMAIERLRGLQKYLKLSEGPQVPFRPWWPSDSELLARELPSCLVKML